VCFCFGSHSITRSINFTQRKNGKYVVIVPLLPLQKKGNGTKIDQRFHGLSRPRPFFPLWATVIAINRDLSGYKRSWKITHNLYIVRLLFKIIRGSTVGRSTLWFVRSERPGFSFTKK